MRKKMGFCVIIVVIIGSSLLLNGMDAVHAGSDENNTAEVDNIVDIEKSDSTEVVTTEPIMEETKLPISEDIPEATVEATGEVTVEPTKEAIVEPTGGKTSGTTEESTVEPTKEATVQPTQGVTVQPTEDVTKEPTQEPTSEPEKPVYKIDLNDMIFQIEATSFEYTGNAIRPKVFIRGMDSSLLLENLDYEVKYYNNINIGTGTVEVIAKGDKYEGTVRVNFNITRVSITKFYTYLNADTFTYNGTYRKPIVKIYNNGGCLLQNVDYTISYINNLHPGTATVRINGMGIYTGTKNINYYIKMASASGLTITGRSTSAIRMQWNRFVGASGYVIQRYNSSTKKYVNVKYVTGGSTNVYLDTGLAQSYKYKYRVCAYVKNGTKYYYSGYSSVVNASTRPVSTSITLSSGYRCVVVKWNRITRADGYEIYMASSRNGTYYRMATAFGNTNSYTKKNLSSGRYYYVKVRPFVYENSTRIYGSFSTIKYAKVR